MKIKTALVAALILVMVIMIVSRGCRGLRGKGRHIRKPRIALISTEKMRVPFLYTGSSKMRSAVNAARSTGLHPKAWTLSC